MKGRKRHTHAVHDDGHDLAHLGSVVQFLAALPSSPGRREQHLQTAMHMSITLTQLFLPGLWQKPGRHKLHYSYSIFTKPTMSRCIYE